MLLGGTEAELLTKKISDVVPSMSEANLRKFWRDLEQWRSYKMETALRDKNGNSIPVELLVNYLQSDESAFCCAFARTIEERLQAQEALEESEAKYRALWSSMTEGCAVCRLIRDDQGDAVDYAILDINPAFAQLTGIDPDIARRVSPEELFGTPTPPHLEEFARVDASEENVSLETSFPKVDKRLRLSAFFLARGRFAIILSDITQLKQAEEAAHDYADSLKELVNAIHAGIVIVDPGTHEILQVNPAACQMIGLPADRLVGQVCHKFICPAEANQCPVTDQGKVIDSSERVLLDANGREIPVLKTVTRVTLNGRERLLETFVDISEQKQIREALKASERRFQELFDSVMEGIGLVDEDERIQFCNPAFAKIFDVTVADQLLGRNILDFATEESKTRIREQTSARMRRESSKYEIDIITDAGNRKTVLVSVSPRFDHEGRYRGAFGAIVDITDRKRMEEALRESEQRFQTVVDNVGIGIALISKEMRVLSLNRQMRNWFPDIDFDEKPLCYRVFNNPPRKEACDYCPTYKTLEDGEPHEAVTETPAGEDIRHYRIVASPIKDEWGEVVAAIEMVDDITEREEAERERRELETKLQHTSKLESIGSLAAGIAHEINTPTQFVGDNTHYLSDSFESLHKLIEKYRELWNRLGNGEDIDSLTEEWKQAEKDADLDFIIEEVPSAISQTLDGVQRVAKIVRSMKDFAHRDDKDKVMCDLNQMLESTLTVARNELKYVADVETEFDPDLPKVECQRAEVNQVFLNLLVNAAHAIADVVGDGSGGKGTISIRTRLDDGNVVVEIGDTGTGIPKEVRHRIFDPFFTTKEVGNGTGQGLAIAHQMIRKHDGSLTFETEEGKGTTFFIRLPIQESDGENAQ
jgi:PAS domain S-box-containing protein